MYSIFKAFFLSLCIIANIHFAYADTASILPPAKTTFFDNNGNPLTSGKVDFYIPSTTTRKATWQDAGETILNTNPVVLDAAGRALILGSGSYRQVVKDRNNNVIWDQVTTSSGSGGTAPIVIGDGQAVGTIIPWAGLTAPSQYVFTYGQEISRVTYAAAFAALTSSQPVFCSSGSPIITGLSDTTNFFIGASVEASCFTGGGSTIVSRTSTTLTLAANANVTANIVAIIYPWGRGNGTTTFNIPDFRGLLLTGNNNMGGIASANLSSTYYFGDPNSIGAQGGTQSKQLNISNLPPYTPLGTIAVTNGAITNTVTGGTKGAIANTSAVAAAGHSFADLGSNIIVSSAQATTTATFSGQGQGGTTVPFSGIAPSRTVNFIIKIIPDTISSDFGVTNIIVDVTTVTGGVNKGILYNNAGVLGNLATFNSGVLTTNASGIPMISNTLPIITGAITNVSGFLSNSYNALGIYPPDDNGNGTGPVFALGDNFDGNVTVNFWNTNISGASTRGYTWYQKTGTSTANILARLTNSGLGLGGIISPSVALDVGSLSTLRDATTASSSGFLSNGAALNVFGGNPTGIPTTSLVPTALISRDESISTGDANTSLSASLLILNSAQSQNVGGANSTQNNGISIIAGKDASSTGNTAGLLSFAYTHGTLGAPFALYGAVLFDNLGDTTSGGIGLEIDVTNGTGVDRPYVPGSFTAAPAFALDLNYGGTANGSAVVNGSAAIQTRAGSGQWEVGQAFWPGAIKIADIQTDTSAVHIIYAPSGAHTNGINLSGATFSGNAWLSTGASINGTGAGSFTGLTATSFFTATGLVTNADLATMATNTIKGNATSGTASPTNLAIPSCSTAASALTWTTNTGFGCNTISATATSMTIGTTTILSGTTTRVLFDNAGVLGEYVISGTGNVAMTTSPVFTTPNLGTPSAVTLTSGTNLPISTGLTGAGTGVLAALSVNIGSAGAPLLFNGAGGTPSSITLTNASGTASSLTAGTVTTNANLTGAITSSGNTTSLGSFSSANLLTALTDETGSGVAVFGTSPVLTTVDARGTWTTGTSWTLPAHTLGGTISGGGNQINNVIIGTATPLAASFTTLGASGVTTLTNATAAGSGTGALVITGGIATTAGGINLNSGSMVFSPTSQELLMGGVSTFARNTGTGLLTVASNAGMTITPSGTLSITSLTQTSAAQSGTMCYNTTGGVVTYDATLGCLASTMAVKDAWKKIEPEQALQAVLKMEPGSFFYKKKMGLPDGEQIGFNAEQMALIDERFVSRDVDGKLRGVKYQQDSALYAGAIQKLEERIAKLEGKQ